jgi:hypothetical protein
MIFHSCVTVAAGVPADSLQGGCVPMAFLLMIWWLQASLLMLWWLADVPVDALVVAGVPVDDLVVGRRPC